jgi:tetratricopeptide (TPR) repeat protein
MTYSRYTVWFGAVALILTATALVSYREISAMSAVPSDGPTDWLEDTTVTPRAAAAPSFAQLYAADASWREHFAQHYSLAELRARGDGRRSAREQMQDRVFAYSRAGARGQAIAELDQWVARNPRDADALLWLARLLNDAGRTDASVRRYRQALAVTGGR